MQSVEHTEEIAAVIAALDTPWLQTKGQPPAWIWHAHQEWAAERDKSGQKYACRYVDEICDALAAKLPPITPEQKKNLHGQVYNCNRWEDRIRKEQEIATMQAQGWEVVSVEFVREAAKSGQRVEVCRRGYNLLMQPAEKTEIMRPHAMPDSTFLMPKGARKRGFDVRRMMQSENRIFVRLARA